MCIRDRCGPNYAPITSEYLTYDEVLPYHTLGLCKWQKLGIPYPLPDAVPPTAEQVKRAEDLLEVSRYPG